MASAVHDKSEQDLSFREVLQSCTTPGVVAVNDHRRITALNAAAETLTGLRAGDVLNRPLEALPAPLARLVQEALNRSRSVPEAEIQLPAGSKAARPVQVSAALTRGAGGKVNGVVAVLTDLTLLQRLEQSVRQYDRLASIGTLAASMAHEIKNALVGVRTFLDLLLQQNKDAELADLVSREFRRIDSIVSQMLKCAGPGKPRQAPVRMHEVLDQSLRLVQYQMEGKNIRLERSFAAPNDLVRGNHYQLEQAFLNLLFNAIDATGPDGRVTLATDIVPPGSPAHALPGSKQHPLLRVSLRDTGQGIPPEQLARLFEPFFTTKPQGTGLGLPITRRIIQEHHGAIAVESQPNQGTTFSILFPALPPAA
jgi:PAS domain S-box-containing protein